MAPAADRRDDLKAIARMLAARIRDLVQQLLPYGREERGEWVALNPTRGDRKPGSFRIHLHGIRAGVWADFATDDAGDALSLVAKAEKAGIKTVQLQFVDIHGAAKAKAVPIC